MGRGRGRVFANLPGRGGEALALWQAQQVADRLAPLAAPRPVEIVPLETHGDRDQAAALSSLGGFGVFTKAIQQALLDGRVDLAVHSLKDLPTLPVPGIECVAVLPRGPVGDAFVSVRYSRFEDLPEGAVVGTSSLRRRARAPPPVLVARPASSLCSARSRAGRAPELGGRPPVPHRC